MHTILETLFNFIRKSPTGKNEDRERFLAKTENFRLLLAANNKALEVMAEMTEESRSDGLFSMVHVRAQSLKAASAVRQMIERLCLMAPGKYGELRDVFNSIVISMEKAMLDKRKHADGPLVLRMRDIRAGSLPQTGSKIAMLGEIRAALGVEVPRGFSITASSFRLFMESTGLDDEINRLTQIHDGEDLEGLRVLEASIRHAIDMTPIPPEIEQAVRDECRNLDNVRMAVRSSAVGEDSAENSFAGQFVSELGVKACDVMESYRNVLASAYSATAMAYRLNRGVREDSLVMCVACMEMIDAVAGGVMYTRSPMGGDDGLVVVTAVPGLPRSVVDGCSLVDSWGVDRASFMIRDKEIVVKETAYVKTSEGRIVKEKLYGNRSGAPSVPDSIVRRLTKVALRIERHFKTPQDIEWALERDGRIVILQCRPLSVLHEPKQSTAVPVRDGDNNASVLLSSCVAASPGVAAGRVVAVLAYDDMTAFPDGGVLLARSAKPHLSALMPKAAALITEYGSPVGHLANVAREFGKPFLIGGPGVVDRLAGVGVVTVDAGSGSVYSGFRRSLINAGTSPEPVTNHSVLAALKQVLSFIVPLSLTDPEAPDFAPEGCKSLHDITRFCHEKAVAEMFSGERKLTANARRLVDKVPMRYWLIDIGGGTANSCGEGCVTVEDIRSNAMQALWRGMTAIPWEGPPRTTAGGLMSVISEAACNPALTPGMANSMGDRNYFTIGKHYCNLQSRLGFHFCTIEGFAGDDPSENYALFQFKGGGADMSRRQSRARLIGDILERHGFIVEVRDDALFARREGVEREEIEQALAIAGYLLVHTRQVDMAATDSAEFSRYGQKFEADIGEVLTSLHDGAQGRRCEA